MKLTSLSIGIVTATLVSLVTGCGPATTSPHATARVKGCEASQLTMRYYGGGVGAGNNFGAIAVLNTAATPCTWRGGLSVVPLTARQQPLGLGTPVMTATATGILLSPHDYVVRTSPAPLGDRWADIDLSGDARDDPKSPNGSCSPRNEVRPAYWGVATLGHKYAVANYDSANAALSRNFFAGVTSCRGLFGVMAVSASY